MGKMGICVCFYRQGWFLRPNDASYAVRTPLGTPEYVGTGSEVFQLMTVLPQKVCVCGVQRMAPLATLNASKLYFFTLARCLICVAFGKTSFADVFSEIALAKSIFFQNFSKKIGSERLSSPAARGSIANMSWTCNILVEDFIGFPTKKTASQSDKNSRRAWPMFTVCKTQIFANRKGAEFW